MAEDEDRTAPASQRRLDQAREAGQVPLSKEVATVAVLATAGMVIALHGGTMARDMVSGLRVFLERPHELEPLAATWAAVRVGLGLMLPLVLATLFVGAASVLLQTGFLIHTAALAPDFARISPMRGFARLFGMATLIDASKSLLKLGVVGWAGWVAVAQVWPILVSLGAGTVSGLAASLPRILAALVLPMLGAQGAIALLDVARVRFKHAQDLRMSREQLKDEARDSDGDPHIKARIRQIRQQRAKRRMIAAVAKATVVITNPTHYAVALAYDRGKGGAPRVVAKGEDDMAARIRAAASKHAVPLVANPLLARALYPVALDAEIPAAQFQAVAEIIAYVWGLSGRRA